MAFQDIKGQLNAVNILQRFLTADKSDGGFLFLGPEGVGKKLTAKIFAKALNCLNLTNDSCDTCISCRKIDKGIHPDVHIYDFSDDEIKIEQIRSLQEEISFKPYEGKKKVFIINNAHNLNFISSNAFLKTLEEPPKDTIIILITDKQNLLLDTIISRCRRIKFYGLSQEVMEKILQADGSLDSNQLKFISFFSQGRIGNALALKGNDCFEEKNKIIDAFFSKHDFENKVLFIKERQDLKFSINILLNFFRDIYLLKTGVSVDNLINIDRKEMLLEYSSLYSYEKLDEILNVLSDSIVYIEQSVNIKLVLSNIGVSLRYN